MDGSTNANSVTTAPPPPRRYDPAREYLSYWRAGQHVIVHWRGPGPYVVRRYDDGGVRCWWTVEATAFEWLYVFTVEALLAHVLGVMSVPEVALDAVLPEAA